MGPIRGQTRPLPVEVGITPEVQHLGAKLNASIHNRFDIEVINAETGEVRQRAQAENIILNQLWTLLFKTNYDSPTYAKYIHYGSGSGTPSTSDTELFTFAGSLSFSTLTSSDDKKNCVFSATRKTTLSESAAVGKTITEIGLAYSASTGSLTTHAMLKDMNGNQISIVKTATDIINLYSTIFIHYSRSYAGGKIIPCLSSCVIKDNSYGYYYSLFQWLCGESVLSTSSHALFWQYPFATGWQKSISNSDSYLSHIIASTNTANKTLTMTAARIKAGYANVNGGIYSLAVGVPDYSNGYQLINFILLPNQSTTITGEPIGTGDGVTKDFVTDFGNISTATIYVDGVVQSSGAAVDTDVPLSGVNIGKYFLFVPEASGTATQSAGGSVCNITADGGTISCPVNPSTWYNPYYAKGVTSITLGSTSQTVEASDDLSTWTTVVSGTTSVTTVASENRNKKYWRISTTSTSGQTAPTFSAASILTTNIHFTTAPASGAVITADYATNTIPKDANHVFDFSMTIQLGEYTG